ncbi:unnamed protein product, partial [Rotaria socialis]
GYPPQPPYQNPRGPTPQQPPNQNPYGQNPYGQNPYPSNAPQQQYPNPYGSNAPPQSYQTPYSANPQQPPGNKRRSLANKNFVRMIQKHACLTKLS